MLATCEVVPTFTSVQFVANLRHHAEDSDEVLEKLKPCKLGGHVLLQTDVFQPVRESASLTAVTRAKVRTTTPDHI